MEDSGPDLIRQAASILELVPICDRCLGRQFAWLSTESSNEARGQSLKLTLSMFADSIYKSGNTTEGLELLKILAENGMFQPAVSLCEKYGQRVEMREDCHLCTIAGVSVFERIPSIAERVVKLLESLDYDSFLVGSTPVEELAELNDEIRGKIGLTDAELLKSEFNRMLGKTLADILGKSVDFEKPDVVTFYSMREDTVDIRINPIFIYGRYRKLMRGIPQSRWDCRKCRGKGCAECDGTGRNYQDSVSEYIAVPIQEALKGTKFKFHAAGREDIDVLMLGSGRPFVVEISEPRLRHPDLDILTEMINSSAAGKVEIESLEITNRNKLQVLKISASESVKEYEALIHTEEEVDANALEKAMQELKGAILDQRTPNRVSHRRSDLIRKKQVIDIRLSKTESHTLEGYFKVQGGTYIKELISGDEGRTSPSLTQVLGTQCMCTQLNVMAVHT
ncbi:MAG: tRNA pseudouridine(54/55) synthase Pus10 [Candidatus Thorarchaeota archaeon]